MAVFINFFLKTLAFLIAVTFFILLFSFFINFPYFYGNNEKKSQYIFKEGDINSNNKIALLELRGPILNEPSDMLEYHLIDNIDGIYVSELIKDLDEIKREKPKGIIISIDSPGGSVSATHKLFNLLEDFKTNNKIIIFFHTNELLVSGGYWAGLAGDKIYADYGALIGNIGVRGPDWIYYDEPILISNGIIGQTIQTKKGIIKYNTIAGRSKDMFDSFRVPTEEEINSLQKIVNNIYIDFVNEVAKKRRIENDFIVNNLGAFIFDAKTAKENYLINDIKNLEQVVMQIVKELKLNDYQIIGKEKTRGFFKNVLQTAIILKYDINLIKNSRICKFSSSYTSVISLDNYYINSC